MADEGDDDGLGGSEMSGLAQGDVCDKRPEAAENSGEEDDVLVLAARAARGGAPPRDKLCELDEDDAEAEGRGALEDGDELEAMFLGDLPDGVATLSGEAALQHGVKEDRYGDSGCRRDRDSTAGADNEGSTVGGSRGPVRTGKASRTPRVRDLPFGEHVIVPKMKRGATRTRSSPRSRS